MNLINTIKLNSQSQIVEEELTPALLKVVHGGSGRLVKARVFDSEWLLSTGSPGPFFPGPNEDELNLNIDQLTHRAMHQMSQSQTVLRIKNYF